MSSIRTFDKLIKLYHIAAHTQFAFSHFYCGKIYNYGRHRIYDNYTCGVEGQFCLIHLCVSFLPRFIIDYI